MKKSRRRTAKTVSRLPDLEHATAAVLNSRFRHGPDPAHRTNSKLEAAYHKADRAIQEIVDLLAAA
jgi:hypothetical protein